NNFCIGINSPFEFLKSFGRFKPRLRRVLDDDKCRRRQPFSAASCLKRFLRKAFSVRRIAKYEVEWLHRSHVAKLRSVSPENSRRSRERQRLDIVANEAARLGGFFHEQRVF